MKYCADKPKRRLHPSSGRIGIPRSLGFDELRVFFDEVLISHGFEPMVSPPSSKRILELGRVRCIDEVCFPLKVFFGHVAALAESGVDTVFVPRLISLCKGRNLCPKLHVLPDLIEHAFPEISVVSAYVDLHHSRRRTLGEHLVDACEPLLVELDCWSKKSASLIVQAMGAQVDRAAQSEPIRSPRRGGDVTIAALGHLYAERDSFLGLGTVRLLEELGASVVHSPAVLPDDEVELEEGIYYEPTVKTARAIEHALRTGVDGIVLLTFFACGPDSYGADTFLYRLERRGVAVPLLRLILDEQTAVEGLVTRLATFVDIARHRKAERSRGAN